MSQVGVIITVLQGEVLDKSFYAESTVCLFTAAAVSLRVYVSFKFAEARNFGKSEKALLRMLNILSDELEYG